MEADEEAEYFVLNEEQTQSLDGDGMCYHYGRKNRGDWISIVYFNMTLNLNY